jgi:hypothetical protein
MPVIVVGTEKNFAALRPRLTGGRVSATAAGELAAAVAAANPHADLEQLAPGTVLTIPAGAPNVSIPGDISIDDATKTAIEGLVNQGTAALERLAAAAKERQSESRVERRALAKALATEEVVAAGRKDKTLGKDVAAARAAVEAEDAAAKDRAAALKKAQDVWAAELAALKALAL